MTDVLTTDPPQKDRPVRQKTGWFRAFWRWHFYASFLVVPILLVLASTGLIYLLRFQLEPLLHADLMKIEAASDSQIRQPYAAQQAAVERAYPDDTVVSMTEPSAADRSTVFSLTEPDGTTRDAYVNPYGAEVLGSLNPDTTLSGYAVRLHGELMSGRLGDLVIELAACWALVMALTGYYLFFKGRKARRRQAKRTGKRLRMRHGIVGSFVGVGLLGLLVSGLPWTGVWGGQAQKIATANDTSMWSLDHGALSDPTSSLDESLPHSHATDVPWAMGESPVPRSDPSGEGVNIANVDTALTVADGEGLRHPMTVALPADDDGVFSVIGYAFDAPSDERTVHVDRYGGQVVSSYGFDDYPLLAKVVSQGIGLHEGRSLGLVSFWASLLMCLGVMFMCVTGPLMWWRRRPKGTAAMGAPRGRLPLRSSPLLLVGIVALGVLLPVFGVSVLVVLLLDRFVLRRVKPMGEFFGVA